MQLPDHLPLASMYTIDLRQLEAGNQHETIKLFDAARSSGFFYVKLPDAGDSAMTDTINNMYTLAKELYAMDESEKLRYDVDKLGPLKLNGYKPMGRNFGGIGGKHDGFETYVVPKDGLLGFDKDFPRPAVIDEFWETLLGFNTIASSLSQAILPSLSKSLGMSTGFEEFHRPNFPSPDIIRLLKYHAQPIEERGESHTAHTDLGSLTFLFTRQPGLQVLAPNDSEWKWVEPKEGHVIVNLGDGIAKLTNNFFHSCLHRVGPLPNQAMEERYSFAYLLRAENATPMTGLDSTMIPQSTDVGSVITSGEWITKKFGALRLGKEKKEASSRAAVLTGRYQAIPV